MKLFIQRYFGKDWKFFWTTNIVWKKLVRVPCTYLGLKLMNLARVLLRIGRNRCSWCNSTDDTKYVHLAQSGRALL